MDDPLRFHFDEHMRLADQRRRLGDLDGAWLALERAHILSQSRPWLHTVAHWRMFTLAVRTRTRTPARRPGETALPWWREAFGQLVRLVVAAPGSWLGRAPLGNTGRSNVGIFTPMPIPDDLAARLAATHLENQDN